MTDESNEASDEVPSGKPAVTRRRSWLLPASALVTVAALVFAAIAFVSWWHADHDDTLKFAHTRDTVALAARQDIVVLNTLDYTKVDSGLQSWLSASTGSLHDQLSQVSAADKKTLTDAKTVTTGKVIDAAVTQLDDRAGTATVIAVVYITVTPAGSKATAPKRNRFSATMTRVGTQWKISDLGQVPVSLS